MADVADILGAGAWRRFSEHDGVRSGLPAPAYRSPAFFDLENDLLLPGQWVFVGFAHRFREAGDAVPVTVGRRPLLLLRDTDGRINAFHNVCRHRCAILVDAPKNVGRALRCPYHAWVYGLDGTLRAAPHFGGYNRDFPEGFSPADHGLRPVRTAIWHDWIFVNTGGGAPDFETYATPLFELVADIDLDRLVPVAELDFGEVRCNWKLLMENFIEPYHVQFLHSKTTRQPLRDHYIIERGPCLGSAVDVADDRPTGSGAEAEKTLDVSSRYLTLFPNFVLGWYAPDQLGVHLNLPVAPDRTHQRRVIYRPADQASDAAEIEELKTLWSKVHGEDHWICERLQSGRESAVADEGGVLSPQWETSVRRFQELVLAGCAGAGE